MKYITTPYRWNPHLMQAIVPCPRCGLPMEFLLYTQTTPCACCNAAELLGLDDDLNTILADTMRRTTALRVAIEED